MVKLPTLTYSLILCASALFLSGCGNDNAKVSCEKIDTSVTSCFESAYGGPLPNTSVVVIKEMINQCEQSNAKRVDMTDEEWLNIEKKFNCLEKIDHCESDTIDTQLEDCNNID